MPSFFTVLNELLFHSADPEIILLILIVMGVLTVSAGFITIIYLYRKYKERQWGWCGCEKNMSGKIVVITGANSGIGLETARTLAAADATVVLACRNAVSAANAITDIRKTTNLGKLEFLELDLSSSESIKNFVSAFLTKFSRVDVLINNAGVYFPPENPPVTNELGVEIHFATNHLGHFLLTHLLSDTIASTDNSRILIVSSELYKNAILNLDDISLATEDLPLRGRNPFYSNSKLANLLHARELNTRLKSRGVTVCAISPGFVYTNLFRHSTHQFGWLRKIAFLPIAFFFMRSTVQGAQTTIHCASSHLVKPSDSALYYQNCQVKPLLHLATDDEKAEELWRLSERMLRLE